MTIDYQALRDAAVAVETEPMHQNFCGVSYGVHAIGGTGTTG